MSLFPIPPNRIYIWDLYTKLKQTFWVAEELSYEEDKSSWMRASPCLVEVLQTINEYFSTADNYVIEFIEKRLSTYYDNDLHIKALLIVIKANEQIHFETYDRYITFAIPDEISIKIKKFQVNESSPAHIPATWIKNFYDSNISIGEILVGHLINEGIFFMSLFDVVGCLEIMFPDEFNTFKKANEFIRRDENLHCHSTCFLIREQMKSGGLSEEVIKKHFMTGVNKAIEFSNKLLDNKIPYISPMNMEQTIKYRANRWLEALDIEEMYSDGKLNEFMIRFIINNRSTDFFTGLVSEYSKTSECTNENILKIFNKN